MKNKKVMKSYRDILLFPRFEQEEKIQNVRKECDKLYNIIAPHITIVFPFLDEITDGELIVSIKVIMSKIKKFSVKFQGISFSDDNYIFLNCVSGNDQIIYIHDLIYNDLLKKHLSDKKYIPHITIGQKDNLKDYKLLNNLIGEFECIIDKVYIEKIGLNQESIILDEIDLK